MYTANVEYHSGQSTVIKGDNLDRLIAILSIASFNYPDISCVTILNKKDKIGSIVCGMFTKTNIKSLKSL